MSESRRSWLAFAITVGLVGALLAWRNAGAISNQELLTGSGEGSDPTHYTGTWHFPRGGPYVLGFESSASAVLLVEDKVVAKGQGIILERVVYQPGNYRFRLETAGRFRLLWHPPGRRGPPEYVPASSLSRGSDPQVRFSRPGTSIRDGVFAIVILALLLAFCAYLARGALRGLEPELLWSSLAILAVAFAVRCVGLGDQGQTWDEDVNWSAGRNYITNLLSLDFQESSWRWNYEHPPVMKYIAGIGAQFSDGYGVSRTLSALLVSLACALLVPIGARLYSLRVGIVAGALACFTPHLIAHSQVVGHEAPTMFFWTLAIWLCLRAHDPSTDPYRLHKRFAVIGVVLGLALFSRYINGLLAPLIGIILVLQSPKEERLKTVWLGLLIIPLAALLTCLLVWPRMWSQPLLHLEESWAKLKKPHGLEAYLGVMTNKPGRSYFLVYLWATAPLGLLLFFGAWVAQALRGRDKSALIVLVWLLVPMVVSFSPVRQDGVRYIMPALLAMNMAAAVGVESVGALCQRFVGSSRALVRLKAGLSALLLVYLVVTCYRIQPFYLDYYGEQVGGPKAVAANKQFEIAWWGEGMNQALQYVNENAPPNARVYKRCFEPGHLAWMRGDLWDTQARSAKQAEWILVYQPHVRSCATPGAIPDGFELVFESHAMGAPLARVYRRR